MTREEFLQMREKYRTGREEDEEREKIAQMEADHYKAEAERINYNIDHSSEIIRQLSDEFKNKSSFNVYDYGFLFVATALQCVRWYFQPKIVPEFSKISNFDRHNASVDGNIEFRRGRDTISLDSDKIAGSQKYPSRVEIFTLPVPYDAMIGSENILIPGVSDIGKNLSGINHHAATLGHDPILGYIFGTMNILTRTITFHTPLMDTNKVIKVPGTPRQQYIGEPVGIGKALLGTIESTSEDVLRLPAGVARQTLHMQSDKYTKGGLPIPFIPADKAQELLNKGWNSYELERLCGHVMRNVGVIGIQAVLCIVINTVIETLYRFTCNENQDDLITEHKIRTILLYSNAISAVSNVVYTIISEDIARIDIGGLAVSLYRIATDSGIRNDIRNEFVYGNYEKSLTLREFSLTGLPTL